MMDLARILRTIDNCYGLSEEYTDHIFNVTSTKYEVALQSAAGERFHMLRSSFSDNELSILDSELSRAFRSNTNLVYRTSNNDLDNLDIVHLDQVLKTIDQKYSLSDKYPDQLFDVVSTKSRVILYSATGEEFDILRSSFSDNELSALDTELSKAFERNINLIYRTSNLDNEEDFSSEEDNSETTENKMDLFQRLYAKDTEIEKLYCPRGSIKKEFKESIKEYKFVMQTHLDKANKRVEELSDVLEDMNIIRRDVSVLGEREEKPIMYLTLRDDFYNCTESGNQAHKTFSNEKVDKYKYEVRKLKGNNNTNNNNKNLNQQFRKRKNSGGTIEFHVKKQKLDTRIGELCA